MKKSLILLPLAAVFLSLTGCKKDNEKSGPSGETVTLSATLGGGEKTEINGFDMKWSDGDAVNINGENYTAKFALGYETATFDNVKSADKYEAYYPASLYQSGKYVLPATQEYAGNKLSSVNPMYAVTTTKTLQFNNICALVKLQVTGEGSVKKIVVSSDNYLCGTFTVSEDGGKYHAVISGSGSKTLTLNCGVGVGLSSEPTTFYIALPDGNLKNLTFKIGENESTPVDANLTAGNLYTKSMSDVIVSTPGALDGEFTINADGGKVNFSQGNLQYRASSNTWRFAENQWDYVGDETAGNVYEGDVKCDNAMISDSYTGWIDLFGWGTTGFQDTRTISTGYQTNYQPYSTSSTAVGDADPAYSVNRYGYGPDYDATNVYGLLVGAKSDWGYNAISNGGNTVNMGWRTLTRSEWTYLFNQRTTNYGDNNRYAEVKVDSKAGMLLFPDNFSSWPADAGAAPTKFNTYDINWNNVNYTIEQFNVLQTAGCVFLPAAGSRNGTSVELAGAYSHYWSSTPDNASNVYHLMFSETLVYPAHNVKTRKARYYGYSVRLVLPVEN